MNFVIIITDTQTKTMVGAYGNPSVDTPNLDRLAATGIRFEHAYTAAPVCTPARGAIFSGMTPAVNGAWCNNTSPYANTPLMGTVFQHFGYRAGYTGKWHLDGSNYFGDGEPGGGFEPDWWFDGKRYAESIGPKLFAAYKQIRTLSDLEAAGFTEQTLWGHGVADRAVDFLDSVGDQPFVLVASFDEPHAPHVAPPQYWEQFKAEDFPEKANFNASVAEKPALQQVQRQQNGERSWQQIAERLVPLFGCNSYIDREIGRVIDAVDKNHADDTMIIYTSDHGDMLGGHGLLSKGPMMYDETSNIPFIVRLPGGSAGQVSNSLVSHLDILPTMLDLAHVEIPEKLHGKSMVSTLADPSAQTREFAFVQFNRFAINHDQFGEFYPIRCIVGERYKLAINLLDTDEFYDLQEDPDEMNNLVNDPGCADARNQLHKALIAEMERVRDPFRSYHWGVRPWNSIRRPFYWGGANRKRPKGYPFEPTVVAQDY